MVAAGRAKHIPHRGGIMSTQRRKFLAHGLAAGAVAGAAAMPREASAQSTFNWKMTSAYAKGSPFYMDGPGSAVDLARRIETMSNGRIRIQVFGAGELIPALEGFDAVSRRHRRDEPCEQLLLDRPHLRRPVLHRRALRPEFPGHERLALRRRRQQLWNEVYAPFNMVPSPAATPACR
jgi:hypothetical protein